MNPAPLLSYVTPRRWIWLYPVTYACHIAEEVWGGSGFPAWVREAAGVRLTNQELVIWNGIGWVAMTAGIVLISRSRKWRWVLTTLAGILLLNVLLHAGGSLVTYSYSPGLISSLALWLPLGLYTLRYEWRYAARSTFVKGLVGVIVFHVFVVILLCRFLV